MIKYDWEKVLTLCKNKPNDVIWYLAYKSGIFKKDLNYVVPVKRKLYLEAKEFPLPYGNSYILNPEPLFINEKQHSIKELYDYIELASYRSFFDWRVRGDATLHYNIAEAYDIDISYNSLLTVENNIIKFKYEQKITEVKNGN